MGCCIMKGVTERCTTRLRLTIVFIFNNNINRLLKNCITKVTNEKISTLIIKVSNIQYSRKLNFDQTTLVNTFLPLLQRTSTINQIFITQEPNIPSPTTLDTVFALQNLTYLAFTLKLLKKKATIKLQLSKEKMETHLTLILTNFYEDAQKLVTFLNDKHLGTTLRRLRKHELSSASGNHHIKCCQIKKNNNKSVSQQHQTSLLPYSSQKKFHYIKKM